MAEQLGYATRRGHLDPGHVQQRRSHPGPKNFDFDINQFSITDERKQAVDFSSPYYDVRQAVIALKCSKIAGATSLADLQGAKLGAQVGTTSYQAITDVIKPTAEPPVYNSNDDAKKALQNGQIDGLVVDLPTAFYMTAAEINDGVIVGQLPQAGGDAGAVRPGAGQGLAADRCVSQARRRAARATAPSTSWRPSGWPRWPAPAELS